MATEYAKVYEDLRARLLRGEWSIGEQLPGISALEEHYGVGLTTIRTAQQMLVADGLISTEQGRGTFVVDIPRVSTRGAKSEGASGPVVRAALGLRFELYDVDGEYVGAFLREDVKGAAVPHSGDRLGRGTFSTLVHDLVGLDLVVHHVDHYLDVPGSRDWAPLAMVVVAVRGCDDAALRAATEALTAEGWSIHRPSVGAP